MLTWIDRATGMMREKQWREGVRCYTAAINAALSEEGQEEGQEETTLALEDLAEVYNRRGVCYEKTGLLSAALSDFSAGIELEA
eukprot:COSAG01_NODE_8492_length_2766_cov_5.493063_1_plen_83_part_10